MNPNAVSMVISWNRVLAFIHEAKYNEAIGKVVFV